MKVAAVILAYLILAYPAYYVLKNFRGNLGMYIGLFTLITFPLTVVIGYFNVWPEESQFLVLTTLGYFAIFGTYWSIERKYMRLKAREEVFKGKVQERYDQIQEEYGNLNELTNRPLNDEEKAYLHKQLKLNYWIGGIALFLEIGGIIWIYLYGGNPIFIYILLGMMALTILAVAMGSFQGRAYLQHDTMYVLKAVVLEKEMRETSKENVYYLILGDKEDEETYRVLVTRSMYNKVQYGDIMQIKNFDDFYSIGPKYEIKVIGSITGSSPPHTDF